MKNSKINNSTLLLIGVLIVACVLSVLLLGMFMYKNYNDVEIAKFGATGDYFNGIVTPFISSISAILIYIAFKQQVDQNEKQALYMNEEAAIYKADRDFDRYMKLIEDVKIYQNEIVLEMTEIKTSETKKYKGIAAIKKYISWLTSPDKNAYKIDNMIDFRKSFYLHLINISFILSKIYPLKENFEDYHTILSAKLIFNTPTLISFLRHLSCLQDKIIINERDKQGARLYDQIKHTQEHFYKLRAE